MREEEKFRRLTVNYDQLERDYKNLEKELEKLHIENQRLNDLIEHQPLEGLPREAPNVAPEHMYDGQRYRVIFDGIWRSSHDALEIDSDGDFENWLEDWNMKIATRILWIGSRP